MTEKEQSDQNTFRAEFYILETSNCLAAQWTEMYHTTWTKVLWRSFYHIFSDIWMWKERIGKPSYFKFCKYAGKD